MSRRLPGWLYAVGGEGKELKHIPSGEVRFKLDPEKASIVRRIYASCIDGMGVYTIARQLNAEGVEVIGRTHVKGRKVQWVDSTVYWILTTRATVGDYVPYHPAKKRNKEKPQLASVPGYFPPVIDEQTFGRAQAAIRTRSKVGRGRRGRRVNLFAGLLHCARTKGTITHRGGGKTPAQLVPLAAVSGRGAKWEMFPGHEFEFAILKLMQEITAKDIQGDDAGNKAEALKGKRDELKELIAKWEAKMDDIDLVDTVSKKLRELNPKLKQAEAAYAAACSAAATPISDALHDVQTLADVLVEDNSDETRMKVRAALRRLITKVTVALSSRGHTKIACVRVDFATEPARFRESLLVYNKKRPLFAISAAANAGLNLKYDWDALQTLYAAHLAGITPEYLNT